MRYAADRINARETVFTFPSYIAAISVVLPIAAIAGIVLFFGGAAERSLAYRFGGLSMLVFTTAVFITASYLTSFQNYRGLLLGFLLGYGISAAAAYSLGVEAVRDWALVGFATGHGLLFVFLFFQFSREFGGREAVNWCVLGYFVRFPDLALAGLMYNLGIWIDKILFWNLSEQSFSIAGWIHASPGIRHGDLARAPLHRPGDGGVHAQAGDRFRPRLRAVPSGAIREWGQRRDIQRAKAAINRALGNGFACLCKVQIVTTVILVLSASQICELLHMGAIAVGVFRVTLFGACLLVMFLAMLTALFYFDDRRGTLLCTAIFFFTRRRSLSLATLLYGHEAWYGFGFVVASAVAVLAATLRVNYSQRHLEQRILTAPQIA